jgi:uncharacterized protein (TIRG00374 family)
MASKTVNPLIRATLPVLIGLAVTAWLFHDEFSADALSNFKFDNRMIIGFALAWLFMAGRDFGLAWRFHTIAAPTLSWSRAIRVDLMCAFTSAITPSAMGGSAFAIFYLNREKVSLGRATTLTLTTLFLDEMFFVVFCPIIMFMMPIDELFHTSAGSALSNGIEVVFWLVYAGIVIWAGILFMGIVVKPRPVARFIKRLFMARRLRRWRKDAFNTADNMIHASTDLRKCNTRWWVNVFGATVLSWFSRYLVVNALFWGVAPDASGWLIFCRQFVVWVILMISPTPGGSGVSEWLFTEYYGDLLPVASMAVILALAWRVVSYYVYLVLGSMLIPTYFGKKRTEN